MLEVSINSPVPIYEQIISGIRNMIERGELVEGESIPSIRKLSSTLELAPNTVARAYNELERQGYVKSYGVKGTFVVWNEAEEPDPEADMKKILERLEIKGYDQDRIMGLVEAYFTQTQQTKW